MPASALPPAEASEASPFRTQSFRFSAPKKILIGWDADSPGGKLTIRNCRVESTDELTGRTDGIRVGSNSELVIENSEIRLPHWRSIRVGGNGSIAVRDSNLRTYGIFHGRNRAITE